MSSSDRRTGSGSRRPARRRGVFLGLLAFLTLFLLLSIGRRGFLAQWRARRQRERLKKSIEILVEEKKRLEDEREALDDPETVERIAREDYGMAKENEKIYQVVPKEE